MKPSLVPKAFPLFSFYVQKKISYLRMIPLGRPRNEATWDSLSIETCTHKQYKKNKHSFALLDKSLNSSYISLSCQTFIHILYSGKLWRIGEKKLRFSQRKLELKWPLTSSVWGKPLQCQEWHMGSRVCPLWDGLSPKNLRGYQSPGAGAQDSAGLWLEVCSYAAMFLWCQDDVHFLLC